MGNTYIESRTLNQAHQKHQKDKQNEAAATENVFDFACVTADSLNQGLCYGSLVLATHIARMKSDYYRSETVDGMQEMIEFMMETTSGGCNLHLLLCDAREEYDNSIAAGPFCDATGPQLWRRIHGHNLILVNKDYTMHACNLNTFEEMLTA